MATEIERKFLLRGEAWRQCADQGTHYIQGYLANNQRCSVRVRIAGADARLNIKSATLGVSRREFEYPIALADAEEILHQLCEGPFIDKTRYCIDHQGHRWEVDVFAGDNQGLVVAEIELRTTDEVFAKPNWLGDEVSDDPRYYNVCLIDHPYKDWV